MLGAGVAKGPVHLIRISLSDPTDHELVEVCGAPRGTATDPPPYDPERRIAIGYDSGNGALSAFRVQRAPRAAVAAPAGARGPHDPVPRHRRVGRARRVGPALARTAGVRAIGDRTGAGPPLLLLRPCAPVTRLPQLGHYPQLEDPSAVAEILRRF